MSIDGVIVHHRGWAVRIEFAPVESWPRIPFEVTGFTCRLHADGTLSDVRAHGLAPDMSSARGNAGFRYVVVSTPFEGTLPEEVYQVLSRVMEKGGMESTVQERV